MTEGERDGVGGGPMTWPHEVVPRLEVIPGERWAIAPDCPMYAVSSEGRVVRLPRVVQQMSRHGTMMERRIPGELMVMCSDNPRLIAERIKPGRYKRIDLGRQVLAAFVRPGRRDEVARRKNRITGDCRLDNLEWTTDRQDDLVARFLAGDAGCHETADMEHAAIRLGVSPSWLGRALTRERRRLGVQAPAVRRPKAVAAALAAQRAAATLQQVSPDEARPLA